LGDTKQKKTMKAIFLPFDVFERHKTVARAIKPKETVLDVGGGVDALKRFIDNEVSVSNLQSGDVLADGRNLPFKNNSFEVVTSVDVLEHVPQKDRKRFVEELLRVSKKKVILSVPLGTKQHLEAEKKILSFLEKRGIESEYLKEHVQRGLPKEEELKKYVDKYAVKTVYSGDFRLNNFLTRMDVTSFKNPYFDKLFYFLKKCLNIKLNVFYFPFCRSNKPRFFTNRIYLFIEK